MLIVFEGPDGVGKTTAMNRLAERLDLAGDKPVSTAHFGAPEGDPLTEYESLIYDHLPHCEHLLVDRLHWSQAVYSKRYRGFSEFFHGGLRHVDMLLQARGALMIHMHDSYASIRERVGRDTAANTDDEHPEYEIENDLASDVRYLLSEYWDVAMASPVPVQSHRFGEFDWERAVIEASALAEQAAALLPWPGYLGPRRPSGLVVGGFVDDDGILNHPGTYAGDVLFRALPDGYGMVSATVTNLRGLWAELGSPPLVSNGVFGEDTIADAGLTEFSSTLPAAVDVASVAAGTWFPVYQRLMALTTTGQINVPHLTEEV